MIRTTVPVPRSSLIFEIHDKPLLRRDISIKTYITRSLPIVSLYRRVNFFNAHITKICNSASLILPFSSELLNCQLTLISLLCDECRI